MSLSDSNFYKTYKKYEGLIMAVQGLLIILLLGSIWLMYIQDLELKKEISTNCGWGEEDYRCYCEKGEALRIKNLMQNLELNISGLINDKVDT